MNRSAMLATTLLSIGIPARVASFSPRSGWGGHTVVEVWPGTHWTVVDPTEVGLVGSIRPNSAAEIRDGWGSLRVFNANVRQNTYLLSPSIAGGKNLYTQDRGFTREPGPGFHSGPFEEDLFRSECKAGVSALPFFSADLHL